MTALVYLAIIALWALFLIPWLGRQRDEQSGRRSGERYNTAMRELRTRRSENLENPEVDADSAENLPWADAGWMAPMREGLASLTSFRGRNGHSRDSGAGRGQAARRRRIVLAVIIAGLIGSAIGAVAGIVPLPVPVAFAALLVAYLIALADQARRSRSAASTDSAAATERHREAARRAHLMAQNLQGTAPSAEQPQASQWDAQPTHVPVYVSKPKASKLPRVMDLTRTDDAWTGQDMVVRAQEMQRQARLAQEQFEREIAVVEPDPVAEVARMANPPEVEPYRRAANG